MGFKDGTANLDPTDAERMRQQRLGRTRTPRPRGWPAAPTSSPARSGSGSSSGTARRSASRSSSSAASKDSGAPIGGTQGARRRSRRSKLDIASHIRLANPRTGADSERERILRRGYNFAEGIDEIGQMGAGLFFLGFQQDPRRQFVSIQSRLAANDLLNEYLFHTGSAIFAIPPGVQPRRLDRRHALRLTPDRRALPGRTMRPSEQGGTSPWPTTRSRRSRTSPTSSATTPARCGSRPTRSEPSRPL